MTNTITIEIPKGKRPVITDDGVTWEDDEYLDFIPRLRQTYYNLDNGGNVDSFEFDDDSIDQSHINFHNCYPDKKSAEKASVLMRRSNAVIRACLLVDPDFEPDWGNSEQQKYSAFYDHQANEWTIGEHIIFQNNIAHVSSGEKVLQMIKLLEKWGIE